MEEYTLCTVKGKPCSGLRGSCISCGKSVEGKIHYSIDGEETLCKKCWRKTVGEARNDHQG